MKTEWLCTDPDTSQYCRQINDFCFSYAEIRQGQKDQYIICHAVIDLRDYELDELWDYCSCYYDSYEEMIAQYGFREALQIMAECVFESSGFDDMEFNMLCYSRTDAYQRLIEWMEKEERNE